MLTIIADKMLTRVAPYSNLRPNLATTFPCSSFNPFTAPEIMPIEEKLAKRDEEDRNNTNCTRRKAIRNFTKIHHGYKFIRYKLRCHNATSCDNFRTWYTDKTQLVQRRSRLIAGK